MLNAITAWRIWRWTASRSLACQKNDPGCRRYWPASLPCPDRGVSIVSQLYDGLVIPSVVFAELKHPNAPGPVKSWAANLPQWAEVKLSTRPYVGVPLDPGEAQAIVLAEELRAASLLLDEAEARREAFRRGLPVAGTIGILEKAAERNLINLPEAFQRLSSTNFYIAPDLLRQALARDEARRQRHRPSGK